MELLRGLDVKMQDSALAGKQPNRRPITINAMELKKDISDSWSEIDMTLSSRKPTKSIPIIHRGKHMRVFEHANFPGLVLKLTSLASVKEMLAYVESSQKIVKDHNLLCCMIPFTEIVELDDTRLVVFVMERLDGMTSPAACQEASEREFELFSLLPEMKEKWKEYFRQAAEFICLTGYWDGGWTNILLMKNGFGFVDFENVQPMVYNITKGIERLLLMAPAEFYEMIVDIAKKHKIDPSSLFEALSSKDIEEAKKRRSEKLDIRSKARSFHQQQNIVKAEKIDKSTLPNRYGYYERKIIDEFNQEVDRNVLFIQGSLVDQRSLGCQPLRHEREREKFDLALEQLKKDKVIAAWTVSENSFQPHLAYFRIYF